MGAGVAIVQAISWMVGKIFADNILKWIATKAILTTLAVVILPIILNNFLWDIVDLMLTIVTDQIGGYSFGNQIIDVTGLAAWFFQKFKIVESFSVIMGAVGIRVALNLIPFVRV